MVPGFEILLECNDKILELKKEDITWVPIDWAYYMDPNAMTTHLGDPIYNIEEEEYWEACQHALKSPYELRANDGDEEGGTAPSDDEDGSEDKSDSSSDSISNANGHDDNDSSTDCDDNSSRSYDSLYSGDDWDEPLVIEKMKMRIYSMRNMTVMFTKYIYIYIYDSDMDYYDEDIKDDAEANRWSDIDSDQCKLINVLENAREKNLQANQMYHNEYPYRHLSNWSDITNVS